MAITHVSVTEARARHDAGAVIVDVRSTREYAAGHPAGSLNVPLLEHDEDTDQLVANPDFVRVIQALFTPETPLMISCQSGVRSVRASLMLETFGFQDVTNVLGGFGGSKNRVAGQPFDAGWQESGLPVETATPGAAYRDLLAKVDEL